MRTVLTIVMALLLTLSSGAALAEDDGSNRERGDVTRGP